VLYISHVDLGFLAWENPKEFENEPLPQLTWDALRKVPYEFLGMGTLMTATWWIIDRRMRLARERAEGTAGDGGEKGGAEV